MTESDMYKEKVRTYLKRTTLGFVRRVEADSIPDVYTSAPRKYFPVQWYELKVVKKLSPGNVIRPSWRTGQLAFVAEQLAQSGNNNVHLIVYLEYCKEYRLYQVCKKSYKDDPSVDPYTVI